MAIIAKHYLSEAELVLITDQLHLWQDFPGKVIEYKRIHRSAEFQRFVRRNRELEGMAGGYWLYTLERLFALRLLASTSTPGVPIIHLESDVYSLLDSDALALLSKKINKTSVPRFSKTRGIASIVFSPNSEQLIADLLVLENILIRDKGLYNDMDLLGAGLNQGVLTELPTIPEKSIDGLIFDAAAIGQYLFGIDPLHTNGGINTGYINPDYDFDIQEGDFSAIPNQHSSDDYRLIWRVDYQSIRILNLHIHSKLKPPLVRPTDSIWNQVISSANTGISVSLGSGIRDEIHVKHVGILNKIRFARKIGFVRQAGRILRHRLPRL